MEIPDIRKVFRRLHLRSTEAEVEAMMDLAGGWGPDRSMVLLVREIGSASLITLERAWRRVVLRVLTART